MKNIVMTLLMIVFFYPSLAVCADQESIIVSNTEQLRDALKTINKSKLGGVIELEDGQYGLSDSPLVIAAAHITIRSKSGIRENVIISGDGMGEGLGNLIDVSADYFSIVGVTLQDSKWHLVQVRAEKDVDFFYMDNCVLQDAGQQLLKVSGGKNGPYSEFGTIQNSLFQYTAGIGPNFYIGGIDAHRSVDWLVKDNIFKYIASPAKQVAEHAIHFWNGSKDIRSIGNVIINSDRGIGYGLMNQENQNSGGVIRNNIIIHNAINHPFADVAIVLESSPHTRISNNIIFSTSTYPNAIEYRFTKTKGVLIKGNVTNKAIKKRDGANATLIGNTTGGFSDQIIDNIQHLIN